MEGGRSICVSNDGHQFPASHMTPDTWINSGYEGEVARCLPHLLRQVTMVKPRLILLMGRFAAHALLETDASIASLRGRVHEVAATPAIVTYHPAYLLRTPLDKAKSWEDLVFARATWRGLQTGSPDPTSNA